MTNQYEIPVYGTPTSTLLGWLNEAVQEGEAWLQHQAPARTWESVRQRLSETAPPDSLSGMSNTGYNKTNRVARELVASLANFRHEGEFSTTWNRKLYGQAHTLTKLDQHWYKATRANEAHRAAIQYAITEGTGYLLEEWDKHFWGPSRGDIRLTAFDPGDVTFIQLPKDTDIQRAYVVLIRYELPLNLAKAIYAPTNRAFAEALTPDRSAPGWLGKGLQKLQQFVSPALRVAGRVRQTSASFPTVDIFHAYIVDRTVNAGSQPVEMGMYHTNWQYTVPALGDPLPTGQFREDSTEYTRAADDADCMLFPYRRLTIFANSGIAYDGSSPWWHGQVPLARIRFNDWPWEALGQSLISDAAIMETGINELMRTIEDAAAARLDPALVYDSNVVSQGWAENLNPRMAGARAEADLSRGDPVMPVLPSSYYDVPTWIPDWIQQQEGRIDYLTGVTDLVAIAKAKQIPGADTLEKLLEMAGPIVQDMVRAVERPLIDLGNWRLSYYFQFYTRQRVITTTGPDGMPTGTPEPEDEAHEPTAAFTFTPDQLIAPLPGESADQTRLRSRALIREFTYDVAQSGINEIHRMTTKLFYLQLMKLGFPISWWTFAKIAQIPNFGPPPDGTHNEMERWIAQKQLEIDLQIELAKQTQEATGGVPGTAGKAPRIPQTGSLPGMGSAGPGRPQSFQRPPKIVTKDGGTRSTVTTAR